MKRLLIAAGLCATPILGFAETYVVPVVTARITPRTYSTTTGFRNASEADVACTGHYTREDGRTLTTSYTIGARSHRVELDTLREAASVGTLRLECSGPVAIAARIQSSADEGRTFETGHVFAAGTDQDAVTPRASRTVRADGDLLLLEPDGTKASFTVLLRGGDGVLVGKQSYALAPYAQRHLSVGAVLADVTRPRVEIRVTAGRVVVLAEARDPALTTLAPALSRDQRVAAAKRLAAEPVDNARPSITEQLLICPFKAAPFRDPATGLCFMRDRWYDPSTGTFLTPDRAGYRDSSNLYAYCKNDPVNCSDPTGRSATVVGGLLGTIGGSGYTVYRSVRHGDPFTWRYIAQGAASGAAIGFGIDTLGAGSGLSATMLGGTAIGAGAGGVFSSVQSGGEWTAYGRGTLKGGVLGAVAGGTGYGIAATGLGGGWAFAGSVTADTYAGAGIDYLFGDATTLSDTFARNAVGSLAGNALGYGARYLLGRSTLPHTAGTTPDELPALAPTELQLIAENLRRQGVEVLIGGDAAARKLAQYEARGLFFPHTNAPGQFVIGGAGTPRVVVYEELLHFAQHRRAGFRLTDRSPYGYGLAEIEAARNLDVLARRLGWTDAERNFIASQRAWWEEQLWKLPRK